MAFSSTTSLLGSQGMAHYAAANQFLDNFAFSRRAQGLPMLSVNWGAWEQVQGGSPMATSRLRTDGTARHEVDGGPSVDAETDCIVLPRTSSSQT